MRRKRKWPLQRLIYPGGKLKTRTFHADSTGPYTNTSFDFDVSGVPNYRKLTVDNFFIGSVTINPRSTNNGTTLERKYDSEKGVFTIYLKVFCNLFLLSADVVCVTCE